MAGLWMQIKSYKGWLLIDVSDPGCWSRLSANSASKVSALSRKPRLERSLRRKAREKGWRNPSWAKDYPRSVFGPYSSLSIDKGLLCILVDDGSMP
jgi:hypothetical protein